MRPNIQKALVAIATVVLMNNGVLAQDARTTGGTSSFRGNSVVVAPAPVYPDYYSPHFSSTNAEGLGRGLGAYASGVGQMNLSNSTAKANVEEARRRAIENRRLAVENYFAMQRINREYRESQLHRRGSMVYTGQVTRTARPTTDLRDLPDRSNDQGDYSVARNRTSARNWSP